MMSAPIVRVLPCPRAKRPRPGLRLRHTFSFAYRNLRAGFGRMALSMLAIALGVALVVAFQLMNAAVLQSFLDTIDAMAGRAQLMVSAGEGLSFSEDVLDQVRAAPGVKLAVPLVRSNAFPDDGSGEMLTVQGVDLTNESAIRVYHDADKPAGAPDGVIEDMVEFLNSPDSIILGKEFADKRGLKKSDKLPLVTPNGVQTFTIKALLEAQGLAQTLRGRIVVMDLFAAERAFTGDRMINQIDVLLNDGAIEAARAEIGRAIGSGLRVEEPEVRKQLIHNSLAGFQAMVTAFSLLAIIVGFVICYSRLRTVFETRTWQVGLLRSVGATRGAAFWELLKESALLGAIGTALGLLVGSLVGTYGLPFFATTTAIAFRMPSTAAQTVASSWALGLGAAVGLGACITAALVPAYRVATTQPIAALRMRGRELALPKGVWTWLPSLGLLGLAGALFVAQQVTARAEIGHLVTVAAALAVLALSTPLVRFGGQALAPVWRLIFGSTGLLAATQLSRRIRRAGLTLAVLGLGLGIVLLLATLEWSFERTLVTTLIQRMQAELIITASRLGAGEWGGSPLAGELIEQVAHIRGVAAVGSESARDIAFRGGTTLLTAFSPSILTDERLYRFRLESDSIPGAQEMMLRGEGVFVNRAFQVKHGVKVGDRLRLPSPNGEREWPVLAISRTPFPPSIVMSRNHYQRIWNDSAVSFLYVALDNPIRRADVEAAIAREFGATHRLQIQNRGDLIEYFASQVRQAFAVQYLVALAILLLVSLSVSDALASSVAEATREYGTFRAVGLSRPDLLKTVLLEGGTIGILGLFLALVTGITLGAFWVYVEFPAILGWMFEFHFPFQFTALAFSVALSMCFLGAFLPSLRAARLNITTALRNE